MIRAPGAKANGQHCDSLVEFVDIYPTLCELAGLPVPENLAGKSLVPLLVDAKSKVKEAAFSQFPREHKGVDYMGYAMRTDRCRYVEWLERATAKIAGRERLIPRRAHCVALSVSCTLIFFCRWSASVLEG